MQNLGPHWRAAEFVGTLTKPHEQLWSQAAALSPGYILESPGDLLKPSISGDSDLISLGWGLYFKSSLLTPIARIEFCHCRHDLEPLASF